MGSGTKTLSMVMASKPGQTVQSTMVNTKTEKSTEKENSHGLMAAISKVTFKITRFKVKVRTLGLTVENLLDLGSTIKWTEKESSPGKMAENMKENTRMIRSTGTAFSTGLMEGNMRVSGSTANSMVKAYILLHLVRPERVSGTQERE